MKKLFIFLISIFCFFVSIETTHAAWLSQSKTSVGFSIYYQGRYMSYNVWYRYYVDGYNAYCRNPNKPGSAGSVNCYNLTVDSSSDTSAYNYGILTILNAGTGYSGNRDYITKEIALRVYESFWPTRSTGCTTINSGYDTPTWMHLQHQNVANRIANNGTVSSLLNQIKYNGTSLSSSFSGTKSCFSSHNSAGRIGGSDPLSYAGSATNLVISGLQAALKFQQEGMASVKLNNPYVQIKAVKKENNQQIYTKLVTYTADLTKMGSASNVPFRFNCKDCAQRGVNYKITINNRVVNGYSNNSKINFKNYVSNEKKVLITIEFTNSTSYKNCQEIHYELEFGSVSNINTNGKWCELASNPGGRQRFYVLYPANGSVATSDSGTKKEGSLRLCDPTCENLKASCNNNRGPAEDCNEFNSKYRGKCIVCTSSMNNPTCKYGETNLTIKEGYEELQDKCANPTKENIKYCVVNNKDKLGNTYQAADIISTENKYCSVWCKENYDIKLPGQQNVTSGRFFTLSATINGTKTCYTNNINKEEFDNDLKYASEELKEAYNDWLSSKTAQNSSLLNAANNRITQIISQYNACSNWNMEYKFDPKIEFYYQEKYMDSLKSNVFEASGSSTKSDITVQRCERETSDDGYNNCPTGWKNTIPKQNQTIFGCDNINGTYSCSNRTIQVPQVINMKESMNVSATYKTPTQFFTIYPNGAIVAAQYNSNITNGSKLDNALPVGVDTARGVYNYVLKIKDLGEYYDTFGLINPLGRILGTEDNIVSDLLDTKKNCNVDECLKGSYDIGSRHFDNGLYVCKYIVNVDNCKREKDGYCNPNCPDDLDCTGTCTKKNNKFYCLGGEECTEAQYNAQCCDHCLPTVNYKCMMTVEDGKIVYYDKNGQKVANQALYAASCCENGHCKGTCKYCLYEDDNLNIDFRQITSEDLNPNDRELGINWSYDTNISKNSGLSLKAYTTTEEITKNGDSVYDIDFDNVTNYNDFAMKVEMDGKMISAIKEYNDNQLDGYVNNSLSCYDYSKNGVVYEKIYCYSTFIDDLITKFGEGKGKPIQFTIDRPFTEEERKHTTDTKYWNIWTDFVLTDNTNIGPSWK